MTWEEFVTRFIGNRDYKSFTFVQILFVYDRWIAAKKYTSLQP